MEPRCGPLTYLKIRLPLALTEVEQLNVAPSKWHHTCRSNLEPKATGVLLLKYLCLRLASKTCNTNTLTIRVLTGSEGNYPITSPVAALGNDGCARHKLKL